MGEEKSQAETWELVGERLSLDFANTVDWPVGEDTQARLDAYNTLVAWGAYTGALPEDRVQALRQRAAREPDAAASVVERAVALRQALRTIVQAVIDGRAPSAEALQAVNQEVARVMPHLRLAPHDGGFHWHWEEDGSALDAMLWPVVHDAAELLTASASLERVKQCDGSTCTWLFLDTSRNRSRRWCSMESCGNRAKARRYYRRQKNESD
ncbi:MAG TPA: ABATE domain-containing protein [Candidatus Sulfomarinibacteraceae bacterium]|nr:ABATE domain-containing protein [Candidatus Sulfomarinibacteraceae bacterium]